MMKNRLIFLFLTGFAFLCTACKNDPKPDETPSPEYTILPNNKVIYEVNVRNYSAQGNFAGLEKDIPRLKELGVDILWLMPVHPVGEKNRIGSKGSPYSVKDYLKINPDYGTASDLKSLVAAAHKENIEIWIDWVANHTAWDHPWVAEHLDYYASQNGKQPYSPNGWNDVVQLNYANQNLRSAMIDAMKYWVREFDIDGFRCDYASGVPLDFWQKAKTEIETIKKITWLNEGDNANYMDVFDFDYAWAFNTALNDFGKNNEPAKLKSACNILFNNAKYQTAGRMVYLTNHDLNAYDGTVFTRFGNNLLPLTVLYFTIYDMPLIYNGQEIGANKVMGLFDVNPVPWTPVNTAVQNLFKKLTLLKRSQPALENGKNRGELVFYNTTNDRIFAYSRKSPTNEVLVMLNFSNAPVSFKFNGAIPAGKFTDYFASGQREFNASDDVQLTANGYAVYLK
jgi:glycosidase